MPARDHFHLLFCTRFLPHSHCFLWQPWSLWLHGLSDGFIALAYCAIPIEILYFMRRRRDQRSMVNSQTEKVLGYARDELPGDVFVYA
jgi:hypothetical protein